MAAWERKEKKIDFWRKMRKGKGKKDLEPHVQSYGHFMLALQELFNSTVCPGSSDPPERNI